jgi:hypothetical protein
LALGTRRALALGTRRVLPAGAGFPGYPGPGPAVMRGRVRACPGARRRKPARRAAGPLVGLADQSLLVRLPLGGAALLERLEELLDLLDAEAALAAWGAVRLEVAHVGPTTDGSERDSQGVGGLRS